MSGASAVVMESAPQAPRGLFSAYGVELEYMLVQSGDLAVWPAADWLLAAAGDGRPSDVERGPISWSNELVLHVVELKTTEPAEALKGLASAFQADVRHANALLEKRQARLLPTAMHPLMQPNRETRLWPHDYQEVYRAYDRIFGCQGHGWSNLQSVHLNLPFCGDEQFARLHAAVRLVLPLVPALAASSPIVEGRYTGLLDSRIDVYRHNSRRIGSLTGRVVPEAVYSEAEYRESILEPMYRDIAPYDPERILRHEWLNARGATARFDRSTIEIRLIDLQECPASDLAICQALAATIQGLVEERCSGHERQRAMPLEALDAILVRTTAAAEQAIVDDPEFLRLFGVDSERKYTAGELWRILLDRLGAAPEFDAFFDVWRRRGTLARRIVDAVGPEPSIGSILGVYDTLGTCLANDEPFDPFAR